MSSLYDLVCAESGAADDDDPVLEAGHEQCATLGYGCAASAKEQGSCGGPDDGGRQRATSKAGCSHPGPG